MPSSGSLLAGGTSDNSLKFTAQWQDAATGLYYLRARYYDPTAGRFLTRVFNDNYNYPLMTIRNAH